MTPNGIALKVTDNKGNVFFPSYEAWGWERINSIIQNTLEIDHVAKVEIVSVNMKGAN